MKTILPVALVLLATAAAAHAEGEGKRARALKGLWYMSGDPARPCHVHFREGGPHIGSHLLVFVNERGGRSVGCCLSGNSLVAANWPGEDGSLRAEFSADPRLPENQVIRWANKSVWTRVPDLSGGWFKGGDKKLSCKVHQKPQEPNAQFVNEKGERAAAFVMGETIRIEKWGGKTVNLRGKIKGNRIEWDNGSFWVRDTK
jgi:hypothetical protein